MKTTKEEYLKILKSIEEKTTDVEDYSSIPISTCCYVEDELRYLEQLIHEYFDNPSLSLDELKEMSGKPVWDNKNKCWYLVHDILKSDKTDNVFIYLTDDMMCYEELRFDKERYYRKEIL